MEIQRFLENKIPTSPTITTATSSLVKATAPFKEYRDLRRRFDPKFTFPKTLSHFKSPFFDILSLFYPHRPPICFPFSFTNCLYPQVLVSSVCLSSLPTPQNPILPLFDSSLFPSICFICTLSLSLYRQYVLLAFFVCFVLGVSGVLFKKTFL